MKEKHERINLKESYELFHIWLLSAAAILGMYALNPVKVSGLDTAEVYTILTLIMINLLYLLITVTGNVYWLPGISCDTAADAGKRKCRICGGKKLLIFIASAALYLCYCQYKQQAIVSSSINSAIAGAVILGAAVIFSGKIKLDGNGKGSLR